VGAEAKQTLMSLDSPYATEEVFWGNREHIAPPGKIHHITKQEAILCE
jgi:hypothetical protein